MTWKKKERKGEWLGEKIEAVNNWTTEENVWASTVWIELTQIFGSTMAQTSGSRKEGKKSEGDLEKKENMEFFSFSGVKISTSNKKHSENADTSTSETMTLEYEINLNVYLHMLMTLHLTKSFLSFAIPLIHIIVIIII